MEVVIDVNVEQNLIHIKSEGTLTMDGAITWLKKLVKHPQRQTGMHVLCEIDKICSTVRALDVETLLMLAGLHVEQFGSDYKVAVVSGESKTLDIIQLYEQYAELDQTPYKAKVFRDLDLSYQWLSACVS